MQVEDVRTADDAVIRVKLMIFYEFNDIETMVRLMAIYLSISFLKTDFRLLLKNIYTSLIVTIKMITQNDTIHKYHYTDTVVLTWIL